MSLKDTSGIEMSLSSSIATSKFLKRLKVPLKLCTLSFLQLLNEKKKLGHLPRLIQIRGFPIEAVVHVNDLQFVALR